MIIMAVDPGLVSGWALWDSTDLVKQSGLQTQEIEYARIGTFVHQKLEVYKTPGVTLELVVERYTMNPRLKTAQPEALKIMGQLELVAQLHDVQLHYYLPSTTKTMLSNTRLKTAGWYRATKDGHANDAARLVGTHLGVRYPEIFGKLFGL